MVATVLRLRLTILKHALRREPWRVIVLVGGMLWAVSLLPSVLGGAVWIGRQQAEVAHDVLVMAAALLFVGWAVVPLLVPGMDDSLDVRRFSTLHVRAPALVPGLLLAALLGVPTLFTAGLTLAPALAWRVSREPGAVAVAVAAWPLALLTLMLVARLSTTLSGRLLGSRRSREIGAALVALALVRGVVAALDLGRLGLEGALERVPGLAHVLGWTPVGAAFAAPAAWAEGDEVGALARLAVAGVGVAAGIVLWTRSLQHALVTPPARGGVARRRLDSLLPPAGEHLARGIPHTPGTTAALAITRRALRSWGTDPRYLSAAIGAVAVPLVLVLLLATVVDAPAAIALSLAPLMAGTIGWGRHNDVAFDGTALWMHVAARVPGWADRAGRATAALLWAMPVTLAVAAVGAVVSGRPDLAPAAVGAGVGVLCAGLAVSAVTSALLVYPVPAPGANPYAAQMGSLGASLVAQVVSSVATLVLCVPVLVAFGAALWWRPGAAWAAFAVGLLGGGLALALGIRLGGRVFDTRAVRLLERLGRV